VQTTRARKKRKDQDLISIQERCWCLRASSKRARAALCPPSTLLFWLGFTLHLYRSQIVHSDFGVLAVELKSRHVGVHGGQTILQSLNEVFVVELLTEGSKGWSIDMWAPPPNADCMALAAHPLKQSFSRRLPAFLRVTNRRESAQKHQ
jgi:hypothetical protein